MCPVLFRFADKDLRVMDQMRLLMLKSVFHTRPHNYANIRVQSEQCTALHKKPHNIAGQSLNFQNQLFIHVYFVICTCVCTHYYKHQWTFY